MSKKSILWFKDITIKDVLRVGGKNASLGEMYSQLSKKGIRVPNGFATTADAYWRFLKENNLESKIGNILDGLNVRNIKDLGLRGRKIRNLILQASLSKEFSSAIVSAYQELSKQYRSQAVDVALRSSATAEDMPTASFAGQMESYLNIRGPKNILTTVRACIASLFPVDKQSPDP